MHDALAPTVVRFRRARLAVAAGVALLLLGGVSLAAVPAQAAPAAASAAAAPASAATMLQRIFDDTNAVRAARDLPALKMSAALNTVAQNWSQQQANADGMSHNPSFSSQMPRGWSNAGENVAYGYAYTGVVAAWTASPGHLANMASRAYTHIGIGFAQASDGTWYYTQNFGRYASGLSDESFPMIEPAAPTTPGATPVYRFWSDRLGGHFYTASKAERNSVITTYAPSTWKYEGIGYNAFGSDGTAGTVPVYRFWSPVYGAHFYTTDEAEKNRVIATWPTIWSYERIAFYAYPLTSSQGIEVSRFWSPVLRHHFFTASTTERDSVMRTYRGTWDYEGAKFRVPAN